MFNLNSGNAPGVPARGAVASSFKPATSVQVVPEAREAKSKTTVTDPTRPSHHLA